ncbi:hypothetical protein PINS_up018538 [Pythium insidiosum]|nr:hypothetical protein PINS_up018538 [Pythium insidiosum]
MVVKLTADPNNWFALYRLRRVQYAKEGITVMSREEIANTKFESPQALVEFVEHLLVAMGYEFVRRENFDMVAFMNPEQLLRDSTYMVSLLMAAYEWECSIHCYKSGGKEYGPPKYFIIDDVVYTPMAKPPKYETGQVAFDKAEQEMDVLMQSVEQKLAKAHPKPVDVQKRLNFDGVSSTDSSPSARDRGSNGSIAQKLFALASEGKLGVDEVTKMLSAMKEQSSRSQARASDREQTQEMHDLLSRDLPQAQQTQERFMTTVLQNVQLRTFDGQGEAVRKLDNGSPSSYTLRTCRIGGLNNALKCSRTNSRAR